MNTPIPHWLVIRGPAASAAVGPARPIAQWLLFSVRTGTPVLVTPPYQPASPTGWKSIGTRIGPDPDSARASRRAGQG